MVSVAEGSQETIVIRLDIKGNTLNESIPVTNVDFTLRCIGITTGEW